MATTKKKTASRKKAAPKAGSKSTASKTTANKAWTERRAQVPTRVVELQTRILKGQQSMFDSTYDAVAKLQERQEDSMTGLLERSKIVPEQVREIAETWTATNRKTRNAYKASVDKSFELMVDWWEGLAAKPAKA